MFLRFRRRMLTYIAFSALFLVTFFFLAGEDLQLRKHVDYVVDKTKGQWDFDPKSGGIKAEDKALKNRPNGGIPGKPTLEKGTYRTTNAIGYEILATSVVVLAKDEPTRQALAVQTQAPIVPAAGPPDVDFEPAKIPIVVGQNPAKDTDAWYLPEHWVKQTEKYPVAPQKLIKLPTGTPEKMPTIQAVFQPETEMQKQTRKNRQAKVKEEFRHAWKGYKSQAWTHDEVRPVSGGVKDPFCGWAATMVDALDTMWIMGLKQEFEEAVEEVGKIDFTTTPREQIPVFETTIRYLGGMLAAYDVSGGDYPVLLSKAKELAEILMGVFDTPNRMPVLYYNWKPVFAMQAKRAGSRANFAELSSLTMEFTRLSQLTGEDKYYDAVARITNELVEWQKRGTKLKGVFPNNVDAQGCNKSGIAIEAHNGTGAPRTAAQLQFFEEPESNVFKGADAPVGGGPANPMNIVKRSGLGEHGTSALSDPSKDWDCAPQGLTGELHGRETFSMGGGQDSGYEYFLKMHLLLGGLEPKYKALYKGAIEAVKNYMLFRPMIPDETRSILFSSKVSTFGHQEKPGDLDVTYEITHLTCFIGGMVGMGAQIFKDPGELSIAERLADGCVYAYSATKSGIMPETARGVPCEDIIDCKWNEALWYRYLDPMLPEDRQRDVNIWDRKKAEKNKVEEEAAAIQNKEAVKLKAEADANLDKERAKLDASYAAYAYRTKPGAQPKLSAEEMMRIDTYLSKHATLRKDQNSTASVAKDAASAQEPPKEGGAAVATNREGVVAPIAESIPQPVDNGVVANPDGHAAAPFAAMAIEPATKAGGHGSRKAKREDAEPLVPQKPKPKGYSLPPPIEGTNTLSTVKTGAQTAGRAMPAIEGDGMVGGAPPQTMPKLKPEDRIDVDGPRPQTHKEYVEERIAREGIPRGFAGMDSAAYILRPEAIESVWYMHRITADPKWAEKGWDMFTAIIRNTKTEFGHSALHNVNIVPTEKVDSMESFWLAETLKYFYLLYSEPELLSLEEWVLNTEAHPFRRPTMAAFLENAERVKKLEEWERSKKFAAAEAARAKAQQEEYLKRLEDIEKAKAAGAGRGGVAAKVVALPDTPVGQTDVELMRKQDEYLKKLGEQEAAAKAGAPVAAVVAPPAVLFNDAEVLQKAKLDEYLKKLGELEAMQNGAAPAAPPAPALAPVVVGGPAAPPTMDLEAYAAKVKADAYAAKLAKLEKLEKDIAAGALDPEAVTEAVKELKNGKA